MPGAWPRGSWTIISFRDGACGPWALGRRRYNPMSYHNGSVWPHDNALIALGLAQYGFTGYALRILESMFEASLHFEFQRLPELFCGFRRRAGDGPTLYPVACSPQSWAAAAVFMLLQAGLGMTVSGTKPHIHFRDSYLPAISRIRPDRESQGRGGESELNHSPAGSRGGHRRDTARGRSGSGRPEVRRMS